MSDEDKKNLLSELHNLCRLFVPNMSVAYQYRDIHGREASLDHKIDDCFNYLRTSIKYSLFDAEACRREIDLLRRQNGK